MKTWAYPVPLCLIVTKKIKFPAKMANNDDELAEVVVAAAATDNKKKKTLVLALVSCLMLLSRMYCTVGHQNTKKFKKSFRHFKNCQNMMPFKTTKN